MDARPAAVLRVRITLHARWFFHEGPSDAGALALRVTGCLARARVNKVVRHNDPTCAAGGPVKLDVASFVGPGLNLAEIEVRAAAGAPGRDRGGGDPSRVALG